MRLSTQMIAELKEIVTQVEHLRQKIVLNAGNEIIGVTELRNGSLEEICDHSKTEIIQKLRTYKVRLENLLCETDHKEQVHLHESHLFGIDYSKFLRVLGRIKVKSNKIPYKLLYDIIHSEKYLIRPSTLYILLIFSPMNLY